MIFDPVLHKYYHDDGITEIPGVTSILTRAGYIDPQWFDSVSRDRGSAVHELCERYAHGIRVDSLGRELRSLEYVNAFSNWMRDTGAYAIKTECLVNNYINGKWYAGKFDGIYEIAGKLVLIDLKTGAKAKWHALQLCAYSMAQYSDMKEKVNPSALVDLYLHADGTYKTDCINSSDMINGIRKFCEAI
jgi:hypothetical protein